MALSQAQVDELVNWFATGGPKSGSVMGGYDLGDLSIYGVGGTQGADGVSMQYGQDAQPWNSTLSGYGVTDIHHQNPGDLVYEYDPTGKYLGEHAIAADHNWQNFLLSAAAMFGGAAMTGGLSAGAAAPTGGTLGEGAISAGGADASISSGVAGAGDLVQADSVNGAFGTSDATYGSTGSLDSLASSDSAFSKALADSGVSASQLSSAGITADDIKAAMKGGWLTQLIAGAASLVAGNKGSKVADTVLAQGNPFGPYRDYFAKQLMTLETDPSAITKTPGYTTGLDAIQRTQAANGYLGSGNMMTALMDYGQNFFAGREGQLANLAGANISPTGAVGSYANIMGSSTATTNNGILQLIQGAIGAANGLDLSGLYGSGT